MSTTLISRNPALQRLRDEGYALRIHNGSSGPYLLVEEVPYVNSQQEIRRGTLVTPLELSAADTVAAPVGNHQMWFIGEHPCHQDGSKLRQIEHGSQATDYGNGLVVHHSFSAKQANGTPYADYYRKVRQYVATISSPAQALQPGVTAKVFKPYIDDAGTSVFKYADSATSRAGIGSMSSRLGQLRIAIVGLGGTGSYILDLVAKTHVREIHLFDRDIFHQHNAFRAPGAAGIGDLTNPKKVTYFADIYARMRDGIIPHVEHVTAENAAELLTGLDFAFVCVDKPEARKDILDALLSLKIPFVDVGMGVQVSKDGCLMGQCRATLATPQRHDHLAKHVSFQQGVDNDLYASDIQVADLNALNAVLAVLKWKKLFGFYIDQTGEHQTVYTIGFHTLTRDET